MSFKIFHSGDWHLDFNASRLGQQYIIDGINQYHVERKERLRKLIQKAIEKKVKYIFLGGDIHNKSIPPPEEYLALQQILLEVPLDIKVHIILGNHDENTRKGSPLSLLKDFRSNISVHTKFETFKDASGIRFFFAPWGTTKEQLAEIYVYPDLNKILLYHVGVTGIDGMHWGEVDGEPGKIHIHDLINLNCRAIMLNHHHDQVELAPYIWYSGSPECFNFGEENQTKGALLWNFHLNPRTQSYIPTEITSIYTDYPKFKTYSPQEFLQLPEERSIHEYMRVKGEVTEEEKKHIREKRDRITCFGLKLDIKTPPIERKERIVGDTNRLILTSFLDKKNIHPEEQSTILDIDQEITREIENE